MKNLNLLFITLVLVLTSCSSDDSNNDSSDDSSTEISGGIAGTWQMVDYIYNGETTFTFEGQTLSNDFIGEAYDIDQAITFEENPNIIKSEGGFNLKVTTTVLGQTSTENVTDLEPISGGAWEVINDELIITTDGEVSKMKIDTNDVLDAASTKWNFLNFRPGLVGGHCIGVDPYYLSSKSLQLGYKPEVILSGRKVNDEIGSHVANEILSLLLKINLDCKKSRCLILGATFKENCPDYRNTRVIDIINVLMKNKVHVDVYDPWIEKESFYAEYQLKIINEIPKIKYEIIILAVSHDCFKEVNISEIKKENTIVYDVKGFLDRSLITKRL